MEDATFLRGGGGGSPVRPGREGSSDETTRSGGLEEEPPLLMTDSGSPSAIGEDPEDDQLLQETLRFLPARPQEEPALLRLRSRDFDWQAQEFGTTRQPPGKPSATAASTVAVGARGAAPAAGRVALAGPCGRLERVRLAEVDSPEAIEHCIRTVFRLPPASRLVVRDALGYAVPLGAGLARLPPGDDPAGGIGVYRVEVAGGNVEAAVCEASNSTVVSPGPVCLKPATCPPSSAAECRQGSRRCDSLEAEKRLILSAALRKPAFVTNEKTVSEGSESEPPSALESSVLLPHSVQIRQDVDVSLLVLESTRSDVGSLGASYSKWDSTVAQRDDFEFWCRLLESTDSSPPDLASSLRLAEDKASSGNRRFRCSAPFDTSPQHIDALYDAWAEDDGLLRKDALRHRLHREHQLSLSEEMLDSALERVCEHFHDASNIADSKVPRIVFASLWQRLILGMACQQGTVSALPDLSLIEYTERESLQERSLSERSFLFGSQSRSAEIQTITAAGSARSSRKTRWAWVETSSSELLLRMAVKFFLHPLATEDMLKAAREGTTKIDRYRHQYFISLEVYALDAKAATPGDTSEDLASAGPTRDRITRSMISLLATGSPPTRSKPSASRDWLLSVIGCMDKKSGGNCDPLDCFATDQTAARKVLQSIRDDLKAHKRQREYQADFLLYSIIDKAASELTPIYFAYGRRLRWLQARLDAQPRSVPKAYVDEVSKVRHELQELRQWVGQIKGVVHHLECDCGSSADDAPDEGPWRFGADARGHGQSMQVFLRHTTYFLDQASDRLSVLDDLARSFSADIERYKSDSMNQALFVLTVATAVFLPAQFLAGVYGMNFVTSDGKPGIPELTMEHGYLFFWLLTGSLLVVFPGLMCICLRCRGNRCLRLRSRSAEKASQSKIKQSQ